MRVKPKYKNIILLIIMLIMSICVINDYIRIIIGNQFTLFGILTNILMIIIIFKINEYFKEYITKKELKKKYRTESK